MDYDVGERLEDSSAEYPHVQQMMTRSLPLEALLCAINESISSPSLSDVDRRIERLCRSYLGASNKQRAIYRRDIKNGYSLLHFCDKVATRALRTTDVSLLDLAAAALALDDRQCDARETITDLAVVHHVAAKIGVDWHSFVNTLAAISSSDMDKFLSEFSKRDPSSLNLELFLRRETDDLNGPFIACERPNFGHTEQKSIDELFKIYGCGQIKIGQDSMDSPV